MKADQTGTISEQIRHSWGWRNATNMAESCGTCGAVDFPSRTGVRCTMMGCATRSGKTCEAWAQKPREEFTRED